MVARLDTTSTTPLPYRRYFFDATKKTPAKAGVFVFISYPFTPPPYETLPRPGVPLIAPPHELFGGLEGCEREENRRIINNISNKSDMTINEINIANQIGQIFDEQKVQVRRGYLIKEFLESKKENDRYTSFDYCYNYFYKFYKRNEIYKISDENNLEMSCLQLGFYLASWGMMRGSSFLLQKSIKNFTKLMIEISKLDTSIFEIDVDNFNDENIGKLLHIKKIIIDSFEEKDRPSDTLITKIMLGIFGNTPAFDRFFKTGMNISSFNKKNLLKIHEFYIENKYMIDNFDIKTLDFYTGKDTDIKYTKAKIIDMYGFMKGNQ